MESIDDLLDLSPLEFEQLVGNAIENLGWTVERPPRGAGYDFKISHTRNENGFLVDVKQFSEDHLISTAEVRKLHSVNVEKGTQALLITSSSFSEHAIKKANKVDIGLIDGIELTKLLNESNEVSASKTVDLTRYTRNDIKSGVSKKEERKSTSSIEGADWGTFDEEIAEKSLRHLQADNPAPQAAITMAFLVLEERIRDKGGFSNSDYGSDLIESAFKEGSGPLSLGQTGGEEVGVKLLYKSVFQTFRNPSSHRHLDNIEKEEAFRIICFVDLLLKLIDSPDILH